MKPTPKTASTVKRAAVYTRKSTSAGLEQAFNSLDAQREACAGYIERQGWTLISDQYDDGGFTGANTDRPAFQRLMADVTAGLVDVVVCYKVDRLSRSLLDFAKVMEQLNQSGASFVSVTQNFSTADAMGRMTLGLLMTFAQFEREMTAERTRDKVLAARRRGQWTGGQTPFGYLLREKKLYPNEVEAATVRTAYALVLERGQVSAAARELNAQDLRPRATKAVLGRVLRWDKNSLAKLLRSPTYAGRLQAGTEVVEAEHTALVPPETWERAQQIMDGNRKGPDGQKSHGRNPAYLLTGLIRCGVCGAPMTPASTRKKVREFRYYVCSARSRGGIEACTAPSLPAPAIERVVVDRIRDASLDRSLAADVREALDRKIRLRRTELDVLRRGLPGQIATLSASMSRLAEELTRTEGRARQAVQAKLEADGERLTATEAQLAKVRRDWDEVDGLAADGAWVTQALADFGTIWKALTMGNQGRLLRALVEKVVVHEAAGRAEVHLVDFSAPLAEQEAA